jgi:putative RNA 2'-phosphotransferase
VLDEDRRVQLSKLASGALRHFPGELGLALDEAGWADLDALAEAVRDRHAWAHRDALEAVLAADPKGRFERDGDRVRATYGHSVDVDPGPGETDDLPERLYHATTPRNLEAIREEGLRPMGRKEVHLSSSPGEALDVGERRADDPVLLVVDVEAARDRGVDLRRRAPTVYTADGVPPEALRRAGAG